ncbi:MAG: hypothetical protein KAJ19_08765 [Gammaproteobacteria bacterium]|nr:hypothetical protein [Gammaproteobacteria bacterium]
MGKVATDGIIDGGLDKFGTCVNLTVCAGQPTSYADITTKKLATTTLTGGDFTKANGDVSGRKSTVTAQSSISITATGTADHVAVDDGAGEYEIFTATAQALTSSGTVSTPAFDTEISDPA